MLMVMLMVSFVKINSFLSYIFPVLEILNFRQSESWVSYKQSLINNMCKWDDNFHFRLCLSVSFY